MLKKTKEGIIITLRISPNASKNEIIKTEEGIKVKITAQPIDGKANKALIEYLSKLLKIPKSLFEIVKGETSKDKNVLIRTRNEEDIEKIKSSNLAKNAKKLIEVIKENPFQNPPPYEKLVGDLKGLYSRRINIQHRLVYKVNDDTIQILSMWTHYENI